MKTGFSLKTDINSTLRTVLVFLLALVLIASAVLSVRLAGWTGRGDRISLSGGGNNSIVNVFHAPGGLRTLSGGKSDQNYNIHDDHKIWQTETRVDIFRQSYMGKYSISVDSSNGDKLIAPGTEGTYRFTIENTGALPMYYELTFESWQQGFRYNIPMYARVFSEKGDYLFGSAAAYAPFENLGEAMDKQTLAGGKSMTYTLQWQWPFEQPATDWLDTALGNQSSYNVYHHYEDVGAGIRIMTKAEVEEETPATPTPVPSAVPTPAPVTLPETETPMATGRAWALVNLISMILTGGIGIYETVFGLKKQKGDENTKPEELAKQEKLRKNKLWDIAPMAASIVTFFLTEDMRLPMTWVDKWTIPMLAFLGVSVGVGYFTRLKKTKEVEESLPVA